MKKVLRFTAYSLLILLILSAALAGFYFSDPEGAQDKIYQAFYPKVQNMDKYRGQFTAEIPQVYELMWIACSLTEAFRNDDNVLNQEGTHRDYLTAVKKHFEPYADHALIKKLDAYLTPEQYDLNHIAIRFLSLNYIIDDRGRLQRTGDYQVPRILTWSFRNRAFLIPENIRLINHFIQDTDFLDFYAQHRPMYEQLEENYPQMVDFKGMFTWLEERYPNRVESYRVICSPLTGGFHNAMWFDGTEEDFQQNLMYVSAPLPQVPAWDSTGAILRGRYGRIVFTEIDHHYVNPFTDRYQTELQLAMPDWRDWNKGRWGYESATSTFNEYMTFGMYVLYVWDTFPKEYRAMVIDDVQRMMVAQRAFHRFDAFSDALLAEYQQLENPRDMATLYEAMFTWMEHTSLALH